MCVRLENSIKMSSPPAQKFQTGFHLKMYFLALLKVHQARGERKKNFLASRVNASKLNDLLNCSRNGGSRQGEPRALRVKLLIFIFNLIRNSFLFSLFNYTIIFSAESHEVLQKNSTRLTVLNNVRLLGISFEFSFSLNFDLLPSYVSRGEFIYAARNESEDKRLREDIFEKILVYLLSRLQTVS